MYKVQITITTLANILGYASLISTALIAIIGTIVEIRLSRHAHLIDKGIELEKEIGK